MSPFAPPWMTAAYNPFGVAHPPVIEPDPVVEAVAGPPVLDVPVVDATGAPVIEWAPATREHLGDGDTVRVTQVGTWKGTRVTGKVTTYERKPATS